MARNRDNGSGSAESDRSLWRRYRAKRIGRAVSGEIEPGLIAAYLEGHLEEAEREAIEAWLAATPGAIDTLIAAREAIQQGDRPVVPPEVHRRAKNLVRSPTLRTGRTRPVEKSHPVALFLRGVVEWSVAAAALATVSVFGFEVGLASVQPRMQFEIAMDQPQVLEMLSPSYEFFGFDAPDAFDPRSFGNGDPS